MSESPVTVTYSLEEILTRLEQKIDHLDQKIDRMEEKFDERLGRLEVGQARLEEKVDSLGKRLDNQEFINRGVLVGLILAFLAGLAKIFGIIGNP